MHYIYSTLANDQLYTNYSKGTAGTPPAPTFKFLVKGGANVLGRLDIQTPRGLVTSIEDNELKKLEENASFQRHRKGGFIAVEKSMKKVESVVGGMTEKDKSAQTTKSDYKNIHSVG